MSMRMWERSGDRSGDGETSRLTAADPDMSPAVAAEVGEASKRAALRSAVLESLKGCGIPIMRIDKEDLRRRIVIPERLRRAMWDATRKRDKEPASAEASTKVEDGEEEEEEEEMPEAPVIVFINSKSGGRQGPVLMGKLLEFVGEEQIMDLAVVKPSDFVQYGLACLEKLADLGDDCAKSTRERLRIVVAGGDGTVGWVLGCLGELYLQNREPVPPIGIIPLGTGNDLSRSFGWGGSFPFAWKSAVKRALYRVSTGPLGRLDSWHVVVSTPHGEEVDLPHSLRRMGQCTFTQDEDIEGELPEKVSCFEGVFYNYFSIGMDAQVAYGFHQLRDEKPHLAQSAIANKLIYTGYSCAQGWFVTPCMSDPTLRGLKNILRISIKKVDSSDWEQVEVPSSVRSVVALNLHNYGSGRNPWGHLKPEYLEKRGFVEAHADDGLLEIFGLKQGWHATFVMVELISAKHIAQAAGIRLEIRGRQWKEAYLQMDGEPWKQPLSNKYSSFVEIIRVPFQSTLIRGE